MTLKEKYGKRALIAGGSEGIGAAFARFLAQAGIDLVLVARRLEKMQQFAQTLQQEFDIDVDCISCDLAQVDAAAQIQQQLGDKPINILVYNAAISYIGPFEDQSAEQQQMLAQANMTTPMCLTQQLARPMLKAGKGAVILMASLAGFQGSGYLAAYAASKAFNRVLAESLWYEWKDRGVDVIACCAGATSTPNYNKTKPKETSMFAPAVQAPKEVVQECLAALGKQPSVITGSGNRLASFFMQRLLPRKQAIQIMGDNTKKMYGMGTEEES